MSPSQKLSQKRTVSYDLLTTLKKIEMKTYKWVDDEMRVAKYGIFSHEHPYAYNLEYAKLPDDSEKEPQTIKDNPNKHALQIASELIRGTNSSIECLQMCCEEYKRDIMEHISKI